jgi:hypothetical protein
MNKKDIGILLSVLLLVIILVILFINFKNNPVNYFRRVNSFKDVTNNKVEFELMDDIISVVNTDRIELNLRYKNTHQNPNQIYYDLVKVNISDNIDKFYPNKRNNNYSRLAIVHQDIQPQNQATNVVIDKLHNKIPSNNDIIDAEVKIINNKDEDKVLKSGINLINKGDVINIKFKSLPEFQRVLFDKNEINKFFMILNFSLSEHPYEYESEILEPVPIELNFKKNIYYSLALVSTDNNDKIIKKYLSRKHKDQSLSIYSDDVGKNELHTIELLSTGDNIKEHVHWDSQNNNQGFMIRSLNDDNKMYYKIDKNGEVKLVYSKTPFDLLLFERDNSGLYFISTIKDNIYANKDFKFVIKRDEYGRFKNMNTDLLEEAVSFDIKENTKDLKDIQTLGDYIDNAIIKSVPTEDPGIINYTYLQRGFTLEDIKVEHSNGAVLSTDGSRHSPHIVVSQNKSIVVVQFTNLGKEERFENELIIDKEKNESVSELYIYIKNDPQYVANMDDLSTSVYDYNNKDKKIQHWNLFNEKISPFHDRGHFYSNVNKSKGYNQNRYIFYGISSTDGIIETFNIANNKYKPELHEGQKIINQNRVKRFVHIIREHIPFSVRSLQLERLLISIPVNLVEFNEDETYNLSKEIKINVLNDKLYPGETIENYHVIYDKGTQLQQLNTCYDSVILNNLNKILLTEKDNVYDIISMNHPDYQKIKFGKCDNIMNRDKDILTMRKANNFSKSILDNLVKKSGDILSKRSFELSNIHADESSLLDQHFIKDYNNYEKNNLIDTNPYSKMDELINYYEIKGKEGFQDSIINITSIDTYFGTYKIFPGQFILLDNLEVQIDSKFIGFIDKGIPIIKFVHDNVLPIYSPFESFQGIKFRLISQDKMVHTVATNNLEKLFFNTGLRSPNFIYLSKHDTEMKNGNTKTIYRVSNREYTTLFQMKKK